MRSSVSWLPARASAVRAALCASAAMCWRYVMRSSAGATRSADSSAMLAPISSPSACFARATTDQSAAASRASRIESGASPSRPSASSPIDTTSSCCRSW